MIHAGHDLNAIIEYDYRQFIYFVNVTKKLHNVRRIEELNLHIALRGDGDTLKDYVESLK